MQPGDALRVAMGLAALQRSQWQSAARIRERQLASLGRTLAFALDRVPHYRQLGIDGARRDPAEWLSRFPVLTKRDVQAAGGGMRADGIQEDSLFRSRTSGSTGEPTVSWFDRSTWLCGKYSLKLRRMLDCGLGPGSCVLIVSELGDEELKQQRRARLAGAGWLFRQEYLPLRGELASHVREIARLRPDAIYAFPSWFADLLDHCERERVALPRVRVAFTSSEMLTDSMRRLLADRLCERVCDIYGCTEFKEVAWQCGLGRHHVNHEAVWIEVEREPGATQGSLLLTTLVNRAAPLIRYRVGDLASLDWQACGCGRKGPGLSGIEGREVELLVLPDGRRLSPYLLTTAVENVAGLRQYQFVQTAADQLELRFVALDGQAVDHAQLTMRVGELLGGLLQLRLLPVAAIPRARGGKRAVFLRELPAAGGC